jgi:hypothetical protein
MQLLQKLLKIKPQKDDSHDTEEAFRDLWNLVHDLKNLPKDILESEHTTDKDKINDFDNLIKLIGYLKQLADPSTKTEKTESIDEEETIKSIQLLQQLIEQLRTSDITPKESINGLDQFRSKTKAFFKSLFSGEKLYDKIDEIERNITDTLEIFGSPFLERGQKEVEILRLNPDPKEARLLYQGFEENIHKLRKELNTSKDDNKKFLAKLLDYVSLIQDLKEETRYRLMNELNLQIKSDGIPMQFNFGSFGRENKEMPKLPGGGGGKENDESIEMYGGAEEKPKETEKEKAQKILEDIQEKRIKLNKIVNFIEKEIKPKYDGYKSNTFKKIFDYEGDDANITKDEKIQKTKSIDDEAINEAKRKKDSIAGEINELTVKIKNFKPDNTDQNKEKENENNKTELKRKEEEYEKAKKEYTKLKGDLFLQYTEAEPNTPPIDNNKIVGLLSNISDKDAENWITSIKTKIGENRNNLEKLRDELIAIAEYPEVKQVNPVKYKQDIKNAFDGNFDDNATDEQKLGIVAAMDNIGKSIQARFESARAALKPVAQAFENALKTYQDTHKPIVTPYGTVQPPRGGGWNADGGTAQDSVEKDFDSFNKAFQRASDAIKKLEDVYNRRTNSAYAASAAQPGMFTNILNKFRKDSFDQGTIVAAQKMEESLKAQKLIPSEVLKISNTDRYIFVFIILFLRSITIQITEYFIGSGKIKTLTNSLIVFSIIYSAVFLLLVGYVNLDTYRLRIIFNYINLNVNSGVILMHLGLLYLITYGIYMIISYINFPIQQVHINAVTEEDKAYLMYQLEIVTMIVWVFLILLALLL